MTNREGRIRWGVVGLGNVTVNRFVPALMRSARSTLVACATRSPETQRGFVEKFALAHSHSDYAELVRDAGVDAVYLATPNSLHFAQARDALAAGKHVLCEKPLALEAAHGEELVALSRSTGRVLKVAYQFRFERLFERVREHVAAGTLGELRTVTLSGCSPVVRTAAWRQAPEEGGILSDLAVHFLDLVPWMTGLEFTDVVARANPHDMAGASVQTISILGTLGRHCHVAIRASRELPSGQQALVVEGTRGSIVCPAWRGVPQLEVILQDSAGRTVETLAPSALFEREIAAFEDEIGGERTALASAEEGVRTIVLADAIRQSVQSGRVIAVGAHVMHSAPVAEAAAR
jgi:1,5-anhydro-D-fructose reductase (1,5-anhydro-D-mannitol-forming)